MPAMRAGLRMKTLGGLAPEPRPTPSGHALRACLGHKPLTRPLDAEEPSSPAPLPHRPTNGGHEDPSGWGFPAQ